MWQDVPVQLVDLPPIAPEFFEPWVPSVIRSADAALLVVDLASDDVADAAMAALDLLAEAHTELVGELPYDVEDERIRHVRTVMVANKLDADGAGDRLEIVRDWLGPRFPIVAVSGLTGGGSGNAPAVGIRFTWECLRVYTKVPGKPADRTRPFTMPIGSTVLDLAREIHRDFEHSLKSARIWGSGIFEGQSVKRDHELHDADVVELHVS